MKKFELFLGSLLAFITYFTFDNTKHFTTALTYLRVFTFNLKTYPCSLFLIVNKSSYKFQRVSKRGSLELSRKEVAFPAPQMKDLFEVRLQESFKLTLGIPLGHDQAFWVSLCLPVLPKEVPKKGFAIQIGTSAALQICVLFLKGSTPKKLQDIMKPKSWGGGRWGGNLCLPKTFVSSVRLGSTSLATAPHTLSTPQQRLPQIHQLWKRFMLQYPRDIPIPALVLIHSLFFFFKQNVIT